MQEISQYFIDTYIRNTTPIDNQIFQNINYQLLNKIEELFKTKTDSLSLYIRLDKTAQTNYEEITKDTTSNQKTILAVNYINALILESLINKLPNFNQSFTETNKEFIELIKQGIQAYNNKQFENVKKYYYCAPLSMEINNILNNNNIQEIAVFERDIDNSYIQRAINTIISYRIKQSIKVFTDSEKLCSYSDNAGNFIQPPHDYTNQNIDHFTNQNNTSII